jgi:hypothetical protein
MEYIEEALIADRSVHSVPPMFGFHPVIRAIKVSAVKRKFGTASRASP